MANNITLSYPSAFHHQFLDLNGKPLTGGKLYTYIAGSTTPVVTYKTISGGTESANRNTNPIILDMAGMAELVIATDTAYKFVLFDKNDAKIAEWDNVTGNIGGGGGVSEDIVVVGTPNEIDVSGSVIQGVKRYVISLSNSVKITILQLIGLYNNVLNSLGNKADKVQGATAGNLAALDASGNLTDSGSKAADFKTKQTPVSDPSASGAGLDFIDSVSQNANGEITPHKKSVQDGTTAQKGVVKLSNAIDSTSVTEAATPKALKDAYDELNNKIVARATFLSQAEWAVQSQLPGDPAKVYYVENGTGEDAYTVYVWKESTSTYEEVDESSIDLDGYWHDSPTTTGSGNVVTNITLGNDGVPQVEKGMSAEPAFSVLPIAKGGTGADTIKGALSTLTSETQHYDTLPTDDTLIVHKFDTATASNGALYTRKLSYLWTYIQNKISSVLGLTATEYGGNAATASAAKSGSALETAINAKLDKNGYVDYKEGFWVGVKWPITPNYESCFWKVCSFSVSNYWSISFELTATNLFFDSVGQETKVVTIFSNSNNSVDKAVECRTKYNKIDERGYGNIMYYTIDNRVVTIYVKTAKKANSTQFLRLVSVTDLSSITNLTWYCEEAPGEQPSSPTKFTEQIVNVTPSVGSQTIPVYSDAYGKLQQCAPSQMSVGSANTASAAASGSALESAINAKQDTISDLATIRSGATAGASALQPSGNGSNLSVTPDGTSTGYDLGSSTTLKAFAQKFKNLVSVLKALAFKDKAAYSDLSSGVQSSLDKADTALQSHQSVTDNNPTLSWGTTSKVGSVGSTDLRVTMPANPAANKLTCYNIDSSLTSLDLNSLTTQGFYYCEGFTSSSVTLTNVPSELNNNTKSWRLEVINQRTRVEQVLINASDNGLDVTTVMGIWKRHRFSNGGWTPWVAMRDSSWINSGTFDAARIPTSLPNVTAGRASKLPATQVGSTTTPVYVDPTGQVQPCTQGPTLKSNTATLYIKGYTDNNIPYYHVKDIKNGCVNHVDFSGITNSTCDITFEAPSLSTGEEYDYIISLEGYTNNNGYSTGACVENCKQILHYISDGNVWVGEGLFLQATDWRQICVVRGNTCEWKRVALS